MCHCLHQLQPLNHLLIVCMYVCVYLLSPYRLLLTKQNKCNARDQASNVVLRKWLCVKYLHRHVIDNQIRDLEACNCARVSIKPGRGTSNSKSKRQLLKLKKVKDNFKNFLKTNCKSEKHNYLTPHSPWEPTCRVTKINISGLSLHREGCSH